MLEIRGFRGLTFDPDVTGSLDKVVTPPYDVIGEEQRQRLAALGPHNMVHVLLPEACGDRDPYENAAQTLEGWISEGALKQDASPSIYLLEQGFTGLEGERHVRRGFFAVARLPEEGEDLVLGHERTFASPVEDRLRLTSATRANLGAIFVLYNDTDKAVTSRLDGTFAEPPHAGAHTMDGVDQRFWRMPIDDSFADLFRDKRLYIADGHHRFATARAYRDRVRSENGGRPGPHDYVLMGFVSFDDPGLAIYPPHRLLDTPPGFALGGFLQRLGEWFDVRECAGSIAEALRATEGCAIGLVAPEGLEYLLALKAGKREELLGTDRGPAWRELGVAVLHCGIIDRILGLPESTQFVYEKDPAHAVERVRSGEKGLAFMLRAVRPEQIRACADAREPMPPKSTYFFPKLPSGVVIHRLE